MSHSHRGCAREVEDAPLSNAMRDIMSRCRPCKDCPRSGSPESMPVEASITWCVGTDRAGWTNTQAPLDFWGRDSEGGLPGNDCSSPK